MPLVINFNAPLNLPKISMKVPIDNLVVSFTPISYERMIFFDDYFYLDPTIENLIKYNKKTIMSHTSKQGEVKCWINSENAWNTYHAVLSGCYLYFYLREEQDKHVGHYCINNCVVIKYNKKNSKGLYIVSVYIH